MGRPETAASGQLGAFCYNASFRPKRAPSPPIFEVSSPAIPRCSPPCTLPRGALYHALLLIPSSLIAGDCWSLEEDDVDRSKTTAPSPPSPSSSLVEQQSPPSGRALLRILASLITRGCQKSTDQSKGRVSSCTPTIRHALLSISSSVVVGGYWKRFLADRSKVLAPCPNSPGPFSVF
ncbi:hypothetical protein COCNU_08G007930 [Cocos nucifera]|uniref:Uncharacterized protein n=1 Tax=Cocos nucifera TaxID=13894 RepID=A0A8K0IIN1_COCNU|nr:hypothetical protein COCNU_08G007930 [Cocos nucifera]